MRGGGRETRKGGRLARDGGGRRREAEGGRREGHRRPMPLRMDHQRGVPVEEELRLFRGQFFKYAKIIQKSD